MEGDSMKMPVLFVGHGSPMNAIEDNEYSRAWRALGRGLPRPRAILAVSAHWYAPGTRVNDAAHPRQIFDMYGFPQALYRLKYEAPGAPELAAEVRALVPATIDNRWGIDHGTWSVLCHMYPEADIPVTQLSVDYGAPAEAHYKMGQALRPLREKGILILASGNVVHDLRRVAWEMEGGFSWADEFDEYIRRAIVEDRPEDVVHYERAGACAREAFPTPDHFYPLMYALGAREQGEPVEVFSNRRVLGSLSMTGYRFG
jgi:4,5-DOPA dioxygenase extradiol